MLGHIIVVVDGAISGTALATLFGLYGGVAANEEAIVHQLCRSCNVPGRTRQLWSRNLHF